MDCSCRVNCWLLRVIGITVLVLLGRSAADGELIDSQSRLTDPYRDALALFAACAYARVKFQVVARTLKI